jgi:hypothetical protein
LGLLIKVEQCLNATGYLNITFTFTFKSFITNRSHPFRAAVYPSANVFLQEDNAPCHKDCPGMVPQATVNSAYTRSQSN